MISVLSPTEVHARKVRELGLDPTVIDLTSPEAIATALRRAAGFFCPCAPSSLVRSVTNSLRGLVAPERQRDLPRCWGDSDVDRPRARPPRPAWCPSSQLASKFPSAPGSGVLAFSTRASRRR